MHDLTESHGYAERTFPVLLTLAAFDAAFDVQGID